MGHSTRASDRPSVLIVDDDREMRRLLRDALERHGFGVREHGAGDGLVPLLEASVPNAVVLDKEMAGANGLDLLSYITRRYPGTSVVLVTAFGGAEVEAEALRRGAAHYMDKPFRIAQLLEVLRGAVSPDRPGADGPTEPGDPKELAGEIVLQARSRGGLVLFADYEGTLCLGTRNSPGGELPLLVRGALVALAATPSTRVVIMSEREARDLEARVNVPGVIYVG